MQHQENYICRMIVQLRKKLQKHEFDLILKIIIIYLIKQVDSKIMYYYSILNHKMFQNSYTM